MKFLNQLFYLLLIVELLNFGLAHSQTIKFPVRPIRIIVGIAPGGGMDAIARTLGQKLSENLGQSVVIDNRPGAGGNVAMEMASNSIADGHSLLFISATSVIHPILYKAKFDILENFLPVSQISAQGYVIVINPSLPARSVKDLVLHAKNNPHKINYASSGIGSPIHLAGELFSSATKTKLVHIPYKGIAPAYIDLLAGNVDMSLPAIMSAMPYIKSGKLIGLAVTLPARSSVIPEFPTITEAGIPGVVVVNWYGVVSPLGTNKHIVNILSKKISDSMNLTEVYKKFQIDGSEVSTSSPDQFKSHIKIEREKWTEVILNANIKVQ